MQRVRMNAVSVGEFHIRLRRVVNERTSEEYRALTDNVYRRSGPQYMDCTAKMLVRLYVGHRKINGE